MRGLRNLIIVLGDQLDSESSAFNGFDPSRDLVWMAEVSGESTYVLSHRVRIVYFLSAMRHFAAELRARKFKVEYRYLEDRSNTGALDTELAATIRKLKPERLVMVEAGEYRVEEMLKRVAVDTGVPLEIRPDEHFYCSRQEFAAKWYLAIYWDAVEWVEMPNVIGMSQFADGGVMGSKPYVASGKYISRMSNYCQHCRYRPDEAVGESACPFTTLYWEFLLKHQAMLEKNPRMLMQVKNLKRLTPEKKAAIQQQAAAHRAGIARGRY